MRSSTHQQPDAKDQFFQHTIKDARDDSGDHGTTIPLIPDSVHRRQSIFRGPGVLERVLEELLFCIGLLRVAGLRKKRLRTQFASSTGIFKYNNDIHATANDVTKGLIGPC